MKKTLLLLSLVCFVLSASAQFTPRSLDQLINKTNPAWPILQQRIASAKNKVEVLPVDTAKAKDALYKTQVTTHSIMGAIVYSTGGILIDNGWIRILGSGSDTLQRSLPDWNKGKAFKEFGDRPEYFLVADDAAGGYFAINYGSFGKDLEYMYYLSPASLKWEPLGMYYEDFVLFCFDGDLNEFYKGIRWSTWKTDIQALKADDVFHILPPLWSAEGKDIEKSFRKPVPAGEQFLYNLHMRQQLGIDK